MDLFIHFMIPFTALAYLKPKFKYALVAGFFGILPDADVFLGYHRSSTHSLLIIIPLVILILLPFRNYLVCGLIGSVSHIFMDLGGYVPIFWPLYNQSVELSIKTQSPLKVELLLSPVNFYSVTLSELPIRVIPSWESVAACSIFMVIALLGLKYRGKHGIQK